MLATCGVTSPEDLKELALCPRGRCVRTPFTLSLNQKYLGSFTPLCVGCSNALVS